MIEKITFGEYRQYAAATRKKYNRNLIKSERGQLDLDESEATELMLGAETGVDVVYAALLDGNENPSVFFRSMLHELDLLASPDMKLPRCERKSIYEAYAREVGDQLAPSDFTYQE